ncbi:hypothetical protein EC968_004470 [Mortierella alpina]|nr:hypothetical protein EC968_004470 [Mortierella alpina]
MSSSSRRPISAYYADFSAECGVASPYTSEPVCVLPHLYLGAEHNALDVTMLSRLGITSVLNVAVEIATAASEELKSLEESAGTRVTTTTTIGDSKIVYTSQGTIIHYKNLSWTHHQKNLKDEFPVAFKFIEETRSLGGKVLVHCQLGVSRSASLVIAYVMKTRQLGLSDAYEFVKARSGVISPNMSLMYQLAEFEKSLKDKPTAPLPLSGSKHTHASPEDDEDIYPYPTDRMDIDREDDDFKLSSRRLSQTVLASAASESQSRRPSTSKRATLVLSRPGLDSPMADKTATAMANTRPRSPHYTTSFAPLSSDPSTMTVPRTPMTDRFSFSSYGPPAAPPTPTTKSFSNKARYEPLQLQQLQENEEYHRSASPATDTFMFEKSCYDVAMDGPSTPITLLPPVPPFFPSSSFRRPPASLASSASSFRTSIPSRPSSTSSASSSASIAHCGTDEVALVKDDGATDVVMPDTPTTPSSHANSTSNKKAMIHSLATVLTRRFSGRFHGQPGSEGSRQADAQCRPSDATVEQGSIQDDTADAAFDKCGADEFSQENKSPEFVFSPRPCSPPLLEAHTFGEFYQALRM